MYKCKNSSLLLMETNNDVAGRYIHPTCTNYLTQTVECSSRGIPSSSIASFASYKKQRRWEGELPSPETRSMLSRLDMSEGESSRRSGWCEKARPGRQTERSGPGWCVAAELREAEGRRHELWSHLQRQGRQTERLNATRRCTVLSLFLQRGAGPFDWTRSLLYFIDLTIFATVFLLSLILWFGCLGRGGEAGGAKDLSPSRRVRDPTWFVRVTSNLFPCWEIDENINLFSGKQKALPSAAS